MIFIKNNKSALTKRGNGDDGVKAVEEAAMAGQQGGGVFHPGKNNSLFAVDN